MAGGGGEMNQALLMVGSAIILAILLCVTFKLAEPHVKEFLNDIHIKIEVSKAENTR
jgi:hypothetical protein